MKVNWEKIGDVVSTAGDGFVIFMLCLISLPFVLIVLPFWPIGWYMNKRP